MVTLTFDVFYLFWYFIAFTVGYLLGRYVRRTKTPKAIKPNYSCATCRHGLGYHDGQCKHQDDWGIKCKCQKYIGDVPPPTFEELTRADR